MKRLNLYYWISTGLIAAFMIFSSISNVLLHPDAVKMIAGDLGYPEYIIPFLGVAKILGSIAILIPGFNKLKEWAYAGLFFDLAGATYSAIAVEGFSLPHLFMFVFIGMLLLSYFLWSKREKLKTA